MSNIFSKFNQKRSNVITGSMRIREPKIFKDEQILKPDYVPDEILHRDKEISEIVASLQPLINSRTPENIFIFGPPGIGKTLSVKYVLRQLEEYTSRIRTVYINCWEYDTRYGVLSAICNDLGEILPRRGLSSDEVLSKLVEAYTRDNLKGMVVVLDEFDRLFYGIRDESNVLYDLARATENLNINISTISISNYKDILTRFDPRIKSSLVSHVIEYKPYDITALKDILRERARYAFYSTALDKEVIPLCSAIGVKSGGDARVALAALWLAGKEAENEGADKVTVEHVDMIRDRILPSVFNYAQKTELSEIEKKILDAIGDKEWVSGQLYKRLKGMKRLKLTDRTFRNYIKRLHELGLIEYSDARYPHGRGKTRLIRRTR